MIQSIISQWDKNKGNLEKWFRKTNQEELTYEEIVKAIFTHVIKALPNEWGMEDEFDIDKMTVIDDGYYQGTQIFIIPRCMYQPDTSDYLMTDNYYGSCSGCDTLLSISEYGGGTPSEEQVKKYISLSLNLVQSLKWLDR